MLKQLSYFSFLLCLLGGLTFTTISCDKKRDTAAQITVVDDNGDPIVGAEVRLWHGGNGDRIDKTSSTNGNGIALFNLSEYYVNGQAGLAVLDIDVTYQTQTNNLGIIEIEEEKTTEQTVTF